MLGESGEVGVIGQGRTQRFAVSDCIEQESGSRRVMTAMEMSRMQWRWRGDEAAHG